MTLATIQDLNALGSSSVLLVALEINIPSTETIYVVNNGENITFLGNEYLAFPFEIGEISANKGETPQFQLKLDNTSRVIERYLVEYDIYLKQNGIDGNGVTCTVHILNTKDLSASILTEYFELTDFSADAKQATFNLGTTSLFNKTYPPRKMYANFCSFKFKDARCGYAGAATTCNKTITDCRAKGNSVRFGGFIGLGMGIRI